MDEIKALANGILNYLDQMDIKPTANNLNQSIGIHNSALRIRELADADNNAVKATEIPKEEKKADKK